MEQLVHVRPGSKNDSLRYDQIDAGKSSKMDNFHQQTLEDLGQVHRDFQTYILPRGYFAKDFKGQNCRDGDPYKTSGERKKKMLEISKENITQDLRTLLRSYHVDDLEALMILADEFEELQKDRQAFAVEPKLAESAAAPVREKM